MSDDNQKPEDIRNRYFEEFLRRRNARERQVPAAPLVPVTVERLMEVLQSAIDSGAISPSDRVAFCSTRDPLSDHMELDASNTDVVKYKGKAILLY